MLPNEINGREEEYVKIPVPHPMLLKMAHPTDLNPPMPLILVTSQSIGCIRSFTGMVLMGYCSCTINCINLFLLITCKSGDVYYLRSNQEKLKIIYLLPNNI